MLDAAMKSAARTALLRLAPQVLVRRHMRRYGRDEVEAFILDLIVPPGSDAIDVGANWGVYARKLALLCRTVHCVEPNPELAAVLRRTLPDNCVVEEAAVAETPGRGTLYMPLDGTRIVDGLASLQPLRRDNLTQIQVKTISLDAFLDFPIGFIKIDVEGAEMPALKGARRLLAKRAPLVLIEIEERHHAGAIAEARRWFELEGYQGWFIDRDRLKPIDAFAPALMQDWRSFDSDAPRRSQPYINNFLFAPVAAITSSTENAIRERIALLRDDID